MQPPDDSQLKVSNTSDHKPPVKKRKPLKTKKKTPSPSPDPSNSDSMEPTERSPGPYRGKCLYQSRKCENERAVKRNGKPHNLCEEHRSKQNQHQRKFDAKKFSRKRRRGSDSDEEEAATNKKHEPENQLEIGPPMTNTVTNYPSVLTAPLTRLPSIQSPTGPILPTVVYPSVRLDAYPRAHVVLSEYPGQRPYLQEPRTCQALPSYSHSELVAASILVPPQSTVPSPSVATPSSAYYKQEPGVPATGQQSVGTPRVLPSLRVTPLSSSPFHAQHFAPGGASVSPSRSVGNILPPLVPFGLRRSPLSAPNSPNK